MTGSTLSALLEPVTLRKEGTWNMATGTQTLHTEDLWITEQGLSYQGLAIPHSTAKKVSPQAPRTQRTVPKPLP